MSRISICAHGCKVNQYEAEQAAAKAAAAGHVLVEFGQPAEVQVVHTCAVTAAAVRDGRQALRRARRLNPSGRVVATGCAAKTDSASLASVPGIELTGDLDAVLPSECAGKCRSCGTGLAHRTRALLKIQDGCRFRCAYCIIPNARPVESSRPVEDVLEEARRLAERGHKEIVLTGVRITGYRPDGEGRGGLTELVRRLGEVPGLARVRLTSLHPAETTPDLLRAIAASPNACPHLHLSLQSGDDGVLKAMRRGYTVQRFAEVVAEARALVPDVAITTDVISGFPGETDEAFQNTLDFLRTVRFSRAHCFTFSPRPGTAAAAMPGQVPVKLARERTKQLIRAAAETALEYRSAMAGQTDSVLVEQEKSPGRMFGHTGRYVEVEFAGDAALAGTLVDVRITGVTETGLVGELEGFNERELTDV